MNKIEIIPLARISRDKQVFIKKTAVRILRLLKKDGFSAEIYPASSPKMKSLNRRFRGKNKSADVLSFEEPSGWPKPGKIRPLGEVYVNAAELKDRNRFVYLLIHGLLHLSGYDHGKKSDRIKMERKEQRLLKHFRNIRID